MSTARPDRAREPLVHLCFHGVGEPRRELEPGEAAYWVSATVFHEILDEVSDDPRVRISFDDGNVSDLALALPALGDRGLRATFFVLAGRLDQTGSLSSAGVAELAAAGMLIGSHGMDHVPWRGLGAVGVRRELVEARDILAAASGQDVAVAALPLGRYDRGVLGHLRRLGYAGVRSSDRSWTHDQRWLQPRFSVRSDDTAATVRQRVLTRASAPRRLQVQATGVLKRWR